MDSKNLHRRRSVAPTGFSLVEMLVAIAIVGGIVGILLPAVQSARESARRVGCLNNLRQIGIGLHAHHSARDCFPHNVSTGGVWYRWGARLLPYLDENPLAGIYDPRVRFDDAKNMAAVQTPIPVMSCPSTPNGPLQHSRFKITPPQWAYAVDYAGSDGPSSDLWKGSPPVVSYPLPGVLDGFFNGTKSRRLREITDGTSQSIAVVECAARPQLWAFGQMVPGSGQISSSPLSKRYMGLCNWADTNTFAVRGFYLGISQPDPAYPGPQIVNGSNFWGIYGVHPAGASLAVADGSTRFIDDSVSADVVAALLTVQAGDFVARP